MSAVLQCVLKYMFIMYLVNVCKWSCCKWKTIFRPCLTMKYDHLIIKWRHIVHLSYSLWCLFFFSGKAPGPKHMHNDQIPCLKTWKFHLKLCTHPGLNQLVSSTSLPPAHLWCKQTVKPQGKGQWLLPEHLLCNWFSLRQAGGSFLSLPPSSLPLPALCIH